MSQKSTSTGKGSSSKGSGSRSKSNFLFRQAKGAKKATVTEAELMSKRGNVTPDDVLALEAATEGAFNNSYI